MLTDTIARKDQIMERFSSLPILQENALYTNEEIVEQLKEIQAALAQGVFEKTHAENLRDRDIMIHFEALAKEYGLDKSKTFARFQKNMKELGYTIGAFTKGLKGEQIARKTLKLLELNSEIKILYNIQLEDEGIKAEYDAIVIAPYGLFTVEVKNWNGNVQISSDGFLEQMSESNFVYDIPGKMSAKETLLKKYLKELFPQNYNAILFFPNERIHVRDDYKKIKICRGGGISYLIRDYDSGISDTGSLPVEDIAKIIITNHKEQKTLCKVKCNEIIEDYASLMAEIEAASSKEKCSVKDVSNGNKNESVAIIQNKVISFVEKTDWIDIAVDVCCGLLGVGFIKKIKRKI